MSATITTRMEIDERIRQHPELLAAVTDASAYLEEQAETVPPPALVRWRFADRDAMQIEVALVDGEDDQPAVHRFWTRWMLDTVARKVNVLKGWRRLLSQRSDRHMTRISELLSQLEQEETGAEVTE